MNCVSEAHCPRGTIPRAASPAASAASATQSSPPCWWPGAAAGPQLRKAGAAVAGLQRRTAAEAAAGVHPRRQGAEVVVEAVARVAPEAVGAAPGAAEAAVRTSLVAAPPRLPSASSSRRRRRRRSAWPWRRHWPLFAWPPLGTTRGRSSGGHRAPLASANWRFWPAMAGGRGAAAPSAASRRARAMKLPPATPTSGH